MGERKIGVREINEERDNAINERVKKININQVI